MCQPHIIGIYLCDNKDLKFLNLQKFLLFGDFHFIFLPDPRTAGWVAPAFHFSIDNTIQVSIGMVQIPEEKEIEILQKMLG